MEIPYKILFNLSNDHYLNRQKSEGRGTNLLNDQLSQIFVNKDGLYRE